MRTELERQSAIGLEIQQYAISKQVVPTALPLGLIKKEIASAVGRGCTRFILDGWPSSVDQHAEFEATVAPVSQVLYLQCSLESLEQRRPESMPAAALQDKLAQWQAQGLPLIDAAAARGIVQTVDGTMADDEVEAALLTLLVPRLVPFFANGGGDLADSAMAVCAAAGYKTLDVAAAIADAPDTATKIAALKRALESTSDGRYVLTGFPLAAEEAQALEATFGAPKIAVTVATAPVKEDGGEEEEAPEPEEGEEGAAPVEDAGVAVVDPTVLAHYQRELFSITPGAEGELELAELRTAFQPLVWVLVAADGNVRTDEVLARAARDRGYAVLRASAIFAAEIAKGTPAGRALATAIAQRRTVPAAVAVALLSAKMQSCIGSKFIVEGFPRAISMGFPMVHDQVFELEAKVGNVHNVLLLDNDVTAGVAFSGDVSNAAAAALFKKEQRPIVDHFATLGKVFTVRTNEYERGGERERERERERWTAQCCVISLPLSYLDTHPTPLPLPSSPHHTPGRRACGGRRIYGRCGRDSHVNERTPFKVTHTRFKERLISTLSNERMKRPVSKHSSTLLMDKPTLVAFDVHRGDLLSKVHLAVVPHCLDVRVL